MKLLYDFMTELCHKMEFSSQWIEFSAISATLLALLFVTFLTQRITRLILVPVSRRVFLKTKTQWDDFMLKRRLPHALAHLPAIYILYQFGHFPDYKIIESILPAIAQIYGIIVFTLIFVRATNAANDMYETTLHAPTRPIKGYIQLIQILVIFLAVIVIIAVLIKKNPWSLLAGMGVMASVLMLVFKDPILGFVASIQLSFNDMIKVGDWIEMPSHRADGTVTDINLTTVKIQNWDKTITTIPTYALVSESFTNWSGMEESGGRRIKRSINIDMQSVQFCDLQMLDKFSHFYLLKDYIAEKQKEITAYNEKLQIPNGDEYNGRRQTNLGVFRHYIELYLRQNPLISKEMTFLVRHLQPTEKGIPLEIYVFSKEQRWAYYESLQADLFDHILAILPEFGLRVFQIPGGADLAGLSLPRQTDGQHPHALPAKPK